jgi:hypothetical protein
MDIFGLTSAGKMPGRQIHAWIAQRLHMGRWEHVRRLVYKAHTANRLPPTVPLASIFYFF